MKKPKSFPRKNFTLEEELGEVYSDLKKVKLVENNYKSLINNSGKQPARNSEFNIKIREKLAATTRHKNEKHTPSLKENKIVETQVSALVLQKEIEAANLAAAQATELAMQEEKKAADAKKALLEIEIVRHSQLQTSLDAFLANSMGEWCNEYLRQLATTAAQVRTLSDLANQQAELLKKSSNT